MNILFTTLYGSNEASAIVAAFRRRRHIVESMPFERIFSYVALDPLSRFAMVDAIVCLGHTEYLGITADDLSRALSLASDLRKLPESCAMRDGRKWKSIPFVLICEQHFYFSFPDDITRLDVTVVRPTDYPDQIVFDVKCAVDAYLTKILNDYEQIGVMVQFEKGKCKVRPALRRKDAKLESGYYHAPSDLRRKHGWVTVMRDREGISSDVAVFEELINMRVNERQMQQFFEENPFFLSQLRSRVQVPHPSYKTNRWSPDFAFTSILGASKSRDIDLLELKGPAEDLLNNHKQHSGFTSILHRAIDQIRNYGKSIRNSENREKILKQFGYVPKSSKLAVVLGTDYKERDRMEVFKEKQKYLTDVEIITYTKILEAQEEQLKLLDDQNQGLSPFRNLF